MGNRLERRKLKDGEGGKREKRNKLPEMKERLKKGAYFSMRAASFAK
jgi:hypothetical protein